MVLVVDEKNFSHEVLNSPIPVVVNFWAPWCSACRVVQPLLLQFQNQWNDQVTLVSINADENFILSNKYRLTTLPTVLLFDRGKVCYRLDQFRSREDLEAAVKSMQAVLERLAVSYSYSA